MTGAMAFRKEYKDEFEKVHGVRLGFMSIFTKACALALQEALRERALQQLVLYPVRGAMVQGSASRVVRRRTHHTTSSAYLS